MPEDNLFTSHSTNETNRWHPPCFVNFKVKVPLIGLLQNHSYFVQTLKPRVCKISVCVGDATQLLPQQHFIQYF